MSAGRAETKLAEKGRKTNVVLSQRRHLKWQDKTSNIPMMASHPGLEQKQAFECFSEVSATGLHTLESRKTVTECPGVLEVAKQSNCVTASWSWGRHFIAFPMGNESVTSSEEPL